jgi:hypothetical protein
VDPIDSSLISTPPLDTTDVESADDRPAVGSWWWVTDPPLDDDSNYDRPDRQWLACVVEIGSNYAKAQGVRFHLRIGMDDFTPGASQSSQRASSSTRKSASTEIRSAN